MSLRLWTGQARTALESRVTSPSCVRGGSCGKAHTARVPERELGMLCAAPAFVRAQANPEGNRPLRHPSTPRASSPPTQAPDKQGPGSRTAPCTPPAAVPAKPHPGNTKSLLLAEAQRGGARRLTLAVPPASARARVPKSPRHEAQRANGTCWRLPHPPIRPAARATGAASRPRWGPRSAPLTVELGEVVHQVGVQNLVLQQVLLVEEQDDRGVLEPGVGDDGPEQGFALLHAVLREGRREHDGRPGRRAGTAGMAGTGLTSLSDSTSTWSYSLRATRNMMDVTFSKQWIHFLRSDRCPPTSTILQATGTQRRGPPDQPLPPARPASARAWRAPESVRAGGAPRGAPAPTRARARRTRHPQPLRLTEESQDREPGNPSAYGDQIQADPWT